MKDKLSFIMKGLNIMINKNGANSLNRQIEEYKNEHVRNLYLQHPDEITRDLIHENETRDDYEGREILELLQNAVDQVEIGGKIYLGLKGGSLTVANTGIPFSFEGVKSLMKSNLSPKRESQNTIGQKGLGFRSLLNWSNDISIFSNGLSIRFSEKYRKKFFDEVEIKDKTALLVAPEVIESTDMEGFDTIIKIKISDDSKTSEVKRQLLEIDKFTLLFLDKITNLTVCIEDKVTLFKRESEQNVVIISENDEDSCFDIFRKKGKIGENNYEVVIAYDDSIVAEDNKLYSYFQTNIDFPIKWKCHVTFDLDNNRNGIKKSDENLQLLSILATFICDTATKMDLHGRYDIFDSLTKTSDFPAGLNIKGKNFNDTFKERFESAMVLPLYSGGRISLIEKPVFYSESPFFFCDLDNSKIIIKSTDATRNRIIEQYSVKFEGSLLSEIISEHAKKWEVSQRVSVFLWWEREFHNSEILPELILDSNDSYVSANTLVYFVRGRDLNIPSWAKINQLNKSYEIELKKQLMQNKAFAEEVEEEQNHIIERVIARNSGKTQYWYNRKLIPHIIFRDADASTILLPVNSSVIGNYDNAKSFVKWLWENYSKNEDWTAPTEVLFNLPSETGLVEKASNLYFDSHYDNPLAAKLFVNDKYHPFINYAKLNIHNDDNSQFLTFISKLGVLRFPPLEKSKINNQKFLSSFDSGLLYSHLPGTETDERNPSLKEASYNIISDLEGILDSISIYELIQWVNKDRNLSDELDLKHPGQISLQWFCKVQTYRNGSFLDYKRSYISFIIQNHKWLEINNVKYKPNQCIFAYNGLDISNVVPTITNKYIKDMADSVGILQKELKIFLRKVGVRDKISELDSNDFYSVLLKLPEMDESGQISEKIYREIVELEDNRFKSCENYKKFIEEGKVFTQNRDGKCYFKATNSYFSNSIQANVGNYHIMYTPLRNGSFDIFKSVFGVQKFEEKYTVDNDSIIFHRKDSDFQNDYREFIGLARAWGERNDNINKRIENMRVQIVSKVILIDNGESKEIDFNYLLIKDKGSSWFIYVSDDVDIDYRKISTCIEEIFAQVANTTSNEIPNQLGELFRDKEGRKFLVEKHFGSLSVVNQVSQNQIRVNLAEVLNLSYDSKLLDNIDFSHFSSIENSSPIIELLSKQNMDIDIVRENGFEYMIDLIPWYKKKIKDYISLHEAKYKNKLFIQFQDKEISEQKLFYKQYLRFKNYYPEDEGLENSINFDFENKLSEVFPVLKFSDVSTSADAIYERNFEKISTDFVFSEFGDFIDERLELKSLIYFLDDEKTKTIREEFNKDNNSSQSGFREDPSPLDPNKISLTRSVIKSNVTLSNNAHYHNGGRFHTKTSINDHNINKAKSGYEAEEMVRKKLKLSYPSLRWTSENSNIPSERNNSVLYDMEYWDDEKKYYIEVKSATKSFIMSLEEYNFANENAEYYELYLVDIKEKKIDGPHKICEFEGSKQATEFQFFFDKN